MNETTTIEHLDRINTEERISNNSSPDICPYNLTFTLFGKDHYVPRQDSVYVNLAVSHIIFVLIPAILLSSLSIFYLVKRLGKHPTKIVFLWICIDCLLGPCTFGFLMDLSFILDWPLLGRCEYRWEGMILWLCYSFAITAYNFLLGFSAITFYISLKYNITRVNFKKMNIALSIVVTAAFVVSSLSVIIAETKFNRSCKIQGSFCHTFLDNGRPIVAVIFGVTRVAVSLLPPVMIVSVSLVLYIVKVKKSVVSLDKTLTKSILILFVVLAGGSMLWNVPTIIMYFGSFSGRERGFIEMISTYTLQLNFVFFPFLVLALHRDAVKDTFLHALDRCLEFVSATCCGNIRNIRRVHTQIQQSIKLREKPAQDEVATTNSQLQSTGDISTREASRKL